MRPAPARPRRTARNVLPFVARPASPLVAPCVAGRFTRSQVRPPFVLRHRPGVDRCLADAWIGPPATITPPSAATQRSAATCPPRAVSPGTCPLSRRQLCPLVEVHTTGPGWLPVCSPTATKPVPVPARLSTLSPPASGTAGAGCHTLPPGEAQAARWPSASQVLPLRAIIAGIAARPAPGPAGTGPVAGPGPVVTPGLSGASAPGPAAPGAATVARAQVCPPSVDSRISGAGVGWLGCAPTAMIVWPAAAIPASDGSNGVAPAAWPAKSASAGEAGGYGVTSVNSGLAGPAEPELPERAMPIAAMVPARRTTAAVAATASRRRRRVLPSAPVVGARPEPVPPPDFSPAVMSSAPA